MKTTHDPLVIPETVEFINKVIANSGNNKFVDLEHQQLEASWRKWLTDSGHNTISTLNHLPHCCFSAGTSPAFAEFISRYPTRRVRVSRSDFALTGILCRAYGREMMPLEQEPLATNDCVIVSLPFSGNGGCYPDFQHMLDCADQLQVPVFIDGAYFGISHGVEYPLDRPCVQDFATSLSKHIASRPFRLGIRFTKQKVDDGLSAPLIGSDLFDRFGSYLSIELLENFSHAWIMSKYLRPSQQICLDKRLTTTNTITLGLGGPEYQSFQRGDYNRVCISDELSRLIS